LGAQPVQGLRNRERGWHPALQIRAHLPIQKGMPDDKLPKMVVIEDCSAERLPTSHVARQILCLCIAWVAMLVSLIALPGTLIFTVVAFVGILIVVGVSWTAAGRAERDGIPATKRAPRFSRR